MVSSHSLSRQIERLIWTRLCIRAHTLNLATLSALFDTSLFIRVHTPNLANLSAFGHLSLYIYNVYVYPDKSNQLEFLVYYSLFHVILRSQSSDITKECTSKTRIHHQESSIPKWNKIRFCPRVLPPCACRPCRTRHSGWWWRAPAGAWWWTSQLSKACRSWWWGCRWAGWQGSSTWWWSPSVGPWGARCNPQGWCCPFCQNGGSYIYIYIYIYMCVRIMYFMNYCILFFYSAFYVADFSESLIHLRCV